MSAAIHVIYVALAPVSTEDEQIAEVVRLGAEWMRDVWHTDSRPALARLGQVGPNAHEGRAYRRLRKAVREILR